MNGCTLITPTKNPLMTPHNRPTPRPAIRPPKNPKCSIALQAITLTTLMIEPCERSNPPETMTNVCA